MALSITGNTIHAHTGIRIPANADAKIDRNKIDAKVGVDVTPQGRKSDKKGLASKMVALGLDFIKTTVWAALRKLIGL